MVFPLYSKYLRGRRDCPYEQKSRKQLTNVELLFLKDLFVYECMCSHDVCLSTCHTTPAWRAENFVMSVLSPFVLLRFQEPNKAASLATLAVGALLFLCLLLSTTSKICLYFLNVIKILFQFYLNLLIIAMYTCTS